MKLTVTELKTEDVFLDMARVHQSHRPRISAGQILKVRFGRKSCLLVARGARANQRGSLSIDLKTRRALGIPAYGEEVDLTLSKANAFEDLVWGWRASEPISRIAVRLGLISVLLGLLGVGLGIWSVLLTLAP